MFCVLKFYFVDFNGMFTSSPSPAWPLKMHVVACHELGNQKRWRNNTFLKTVAQI